MLAMLAAVAPAKSNAPASTATLSRAELDDVRARYGLCRTALGGASADGPARAVQPAKDTICFAGPIDRRSVDLLLDVFAKVPKETPTVFVALSGGGHVAPALDVAETILERNVTFVAGPLCGSSCANYFFIPASRRVVMEGSLLLFHGGMSPGFIAARARDLAGERGKRRPDPLKLAQFERALANARQGAARQERMLRAVGADPRFFDFFDHIPAHPGSKYARDCARARQARMFLLSDRYLAERGIPVHVGLGPRTGKEMEAIQRQRGSGTGDICFWS
jgi:hypothetical protein